MPELPWPMLMRRISRGPSEQLEETFLHQLVSSPPESVNADLQNTVWSHTLPKKERVTISLDTRAGRLDIFPAPG